MNAMPDPVLLAGNTIRYTRAVLIGLLPPQGIGRIVNSRASAIRDEVSGNVEHGILASSVHRLSMDSIGRCKSVVDDYLKFLTSQKVVVPKRWQSSIYEELREQVRTMLRKKMYGCLSIQDFMRGPQGGTVSAKKKNVKKKYRKLF